MAGVKGKSGPPGNLNNCKRPWQAFWRRKGLRTEDRWILPALEAYSSALISDKPDLTAVEGRIIEIAQTARGATMLILAEAARSGFMRKVKGTWDLAPGVRELGKFLAVERGCLLGLGLDRRAKPVKSLAEYLQDARSEAKEEQ